jgi:chitinase domain-containing protein 1
LPSWIRIPNPDPLTRLNPDSQPWLQVTVSSNEDYLVGGAHDVDKGWMAEVQKKGAKIVPRILFER